MPREIRYGRARRESENAWSRAQDWEPLDVGWWDPCPVTWEAVLVFVTPAVNRVQVLLRTEGGAVDLIDPCLACRVA